MHTKHTGVAFIALCAIVVCSLPVYAASMTSDYRVACYREMGYGPIVFKSKKLSGWQLQSRFNYQSSPYYAAPWIENAVLPVSVTSVRASHAFSFVLPQRIYASYDRADATMRSSTNWQYLPANMGTFTRLGWLLGDPETLNMAIEYEHRKVGSSENNALSLGVHYWF